MINHITLTHQIEVQNKHQIGTNNPRPITILQTIVSPRIEYLTSIIHKKHNGDNQIEIKLEKSISIISCINSIQPNEAIPKLCKIFV